MRGARASTTPTWSRDDGRRRVDLGRVHPQQGSVLLFPGDRLNRLPGSAAPPNRQARAREGEAARLAALARGADENAAVAEGTPRGRSRSATLMKDTRTRSGAEPSAVCGAAGRADRYAFFGRFAVAGVYGFTAAAHGVGCTRSAGRPRDGGRAPRFGSVASGRGRGDKKNGDAGDGEWEELPGMEMVRPLAAAMRQ